MNSRPATVVFAYSEVGFVCLEELLRRGANVAAVFTHEDDPGEEIWFRSVREFAASRGILTRLDKKIGVDALELLRSLNAELIFSFYYRSMIPMEALNMARLGAYNMHGSLLPKYRGRACVNWAVINGEKETGATLHVMTERPDRGDIVGQEKVAVAYRDTGLDVFLKVAEAARLVLARSLDGIEAGTARAAAQDESRATEFGRRRPEDGLIDWNRSAGEIYNLVRALTRPFPGAFTVSGGRRLYIWEAEPIEGKAAPGEAVSVSPPVFGTGSGLLKALRWQAAGEAERSLGQ